jgi:uncharacterized protein YbjT (DUF2867 family)
MVALVIGANGFTGRKLTKRLLDDSLFSKVYVLVRQSLEIDHPKLVECITNFNQLNDNSIPLDVEILYCCLGTTIRKAKLKRNFRRVDFEYTTQLAQIAKRKGVSAFHLISSIGANPNSVFFYQKVKGEVEQFLIGLKFDSLVIYRPSVIYGGRKEFRLFESFAAWISRNFTFLFFGKLKRILAITGDQLAFCMHNKSKCNYQGLKIIESEEISKS